MRRRCAVLVLAWMSVFLFSAGAVRGQSDSSIVGRGSMVIVEPSALKDIVAVEAGAYHSLGLKSDGTIVAWGWNEYGQCNVPAPSDSFVAVAGGWVA